MGNAAFHAGIVNAFGGAGASADAVIGRTIVAGVIGGSVSATGGGKFANGAYTAAFQHFFNHEADEFAKKLHEAQPALAQRAESFEDSTNWDTNKRRLVGGAYLEGDFKCNQFCGEMIESEGLYQPFRMRGGVINAAAKYLSAQNWFDGAGVGWGFVRYGPLHAGDIVTDGIHMGIYVGQRGVASASSKTNTVVVNNWGIRNSTLDGFHVAASGVRVLRYRGFYANNRQGGGGWHVRNAPTLINRRNQE